MSEASVVQQSGPVDLVTVTPGALEKIKALYGEEIAKDPEVAGLRLGVQGGGCSGFSYKLAFDRAKDNDYRIILNDTTILIDPKSAIYLKGIRLDYQGGLDGKGFVFENPNASSTCGCGESFSI